MGDFDIAWHVLPQLRWNAILYKGFAYSDNSYFLRLKIVLIREKTPFVIKVEISFISICKPQSLMIYAGFMS